MTQAPPGCRRSSYALLVEHATTAPLLFAGSTRKESRAGRRAAFIALSAAAQAVLVGVLLVARTSGPVAGGERSIEVRLVRPQVTRVSPLPPAPARSTPRRAPAPAAPAAPRVERIAQPRTVPSEVPLPAPAPEPTGSGEATGSGAGDAGHPDGVVGGMPGAPGVPALQQVPPPEPIPARPADLASVRAGIARTLVYPAQARRNGLGGKVVLSFLLLANGAIRDLAVRAGSGSALLDAAALAAVREAAPFPPPGVEVLVVVPVVFRPE
jgi:periplasmic protein TonB